MQIQRREAIIVAGGLIAICVSFGVGYAIGKKKPPTVLEKIKIYNEKDYVAGILNESRTDDNQPELPFERRTDTSLAGSGQTERLLENVVGNSVEDDFAEEQRNEEDVPGDSRFGRFDNSNELVGPNWLVESGWNQEAENAFREGNPGRPYVISQLEYSSNESGCLQESLTYYAGDMVLVSDREEAPMYGYTKTIGIALERFGHGSGDADIVYVRNEERDCEYEIKREDGHYTIEVLGAEEEFRHSKGKKKKKEPLPKFRMD